MIEFEVNFKLQFIDLDFILNFLQVTVLGEEIIIVTASGIES